MVRLRVITLASHDFPTGVNQLGLAQLNERSREIFRQIVESYLADRRAGRLAQSVAHPADDVVTGVGAQCHVRSGAARSCLCAAYLGRPAADRDGTAVLRRCADADRRPHRARPPRHRSASRGLRPRQVGGGGVDRSVGFAVRPKPRRRASCSPQNRIRGSSTSSSCGSSPSAPW